MHLKKYNGKDYGQDLNPGLLGEFSVPLKIGKIIATPFKLQVRFW